LTPRQQRFAELISTFFGAGKVSKAPGTVGTLATVPLAFLFMKLGPIVHMTGVFLLTFLGIWASEMYQRQQGGHDRQEIVIDEVVGFLITMTWLPITWQSFVGGFLLFRLFDIWKPWPIRLLDRNVKGGFGVVADDMAAGILANVILNVVYAKTNWLGAQLISL